jgi:hypothetical protein
VQLHDKLYSKKLLSNLRLDIAFIPHIGIGNSKELDVSEHRINNLDIPFIKGKIGELTIARYDGHSVSEVAVIQLN